MLKNILKKIILIIIFYIVFVLVAPDLALQMDKKLNINFNSKIIEIKNKLVFAFSSEKNLKDSLQKTAEKMDSKTEKVTNKLNHPTPNMEKKLKNLKKINDEKK